MELAKILVIDDDRAIRGLVTHAFKDTDYVVHCAEDALVGLDAVRSLRPDVVLLDVQLPEMSGLEAFAKLRELDPKLPVIYITAGGSSDAAIQAMQQGALDYILKPLDVNVLRNTVEQALEIRRLMLVKVELGDQIVSPADQGEQIVGRSPQMQEVFKAIGRVASQNVAVLVRGESGTGKELVARAIYHHSDRSSKPFLAVNCAAIPEPLLESELFGHEKGAFTGAERQRIGKFEQCDGGTIFLDEVGDMSPTLQSKVLRLLQEQEFQRVGGSTSVRVDVRVIAATNRDLERMVADGDFREDLLYRINGYTIHLPPLRERGDDLTLLIQHFLARLSRELNVRVDGLSPEATERLKRYSWPGNIRQLEGVLRQTLLRATGTVISPSFLPPAILAVKKENELERGASHPPAGRDSLDASGDADKAAARAAADEFDRADPLLDEEEAAATEGLQFDLRQFLHEQLRQDSSNLYAETLEMMERYVITRILARTGGNQSEAARVLGITRGSLRHKIRALGIQINARIG